MSRSRLFQVLDPTFFSALVEVPGLYDLWTGSGDDADLTDLGLDARRFAKHPAVRTCLAGRDLGRASSLDERIDLGPWLDAIVFALKLLDPVEADAYEAFAGRPVSDPDFSIRQLPDRMSYGFDVATTRRFAGLFGFAAGIQFDAAFDPAKLAAAGVRPPMWDDPSTRGEVIECKRRLSWSLSDAAKKKRCALFRGVL